jgi:ribose 5-phosphate isomerase B
VRVAVDSDDAGIELKRVVVEDLNMLGSRKTDYPDIRYNLARRAAQKEFDRGVLICGTGLAMCMIANKVTGVYAGVCHDVYSAEGLRKSNDTRMITLGARVIGPELAKTILSAWIHSEFEAGRSGPKVARMRELEKLERQEAGKS